MWTILLGVISLSPGGIRPIRRPLVRRVTAPRLSDDALSVRVLGALLDAEEKPYLLWREDMRPLSINLDLLNHRAKMLERRRDRRGASQTLERCCEIDPMDGRAWLAKARICERDGRPKEAAELLKQGLRYDTENAYLLQAYGALQARRGRSDEALELYTAAVKASPRHAPAWVACGLLLEKRRQHDAAAACFMMAQRVAPRSYYAWQVIGEWHKRRGELGSAREAYHRSLQLNMGNAASYHAWGVLEWRCGHHELASQLFKKGLAASPKNRYILQSWAVMEARAGKSLEAQRLFAQATDSSGGKQGRGGKPRGMRPDGATWQAKALQCRAEGKFLQARRNFERGIAVDRTHIPLYHAWGQLELEQSNVTGAREIYQRGVWASRNEVETISLWTAWAMLEERAGDYSAARAYLREALKRDRFAVDVRMVWANFEARKGDLSEARTLYEGALRIDGRNSEVWAAYEEMERAHGSDEASYRVWQRAEAAMAYDSDGKPATPPQASVSALPSKALQLAALDAEEWARSAAATAAMSVQQPDGEQANGKRGWGVRTRTAVEAAYGSPVRSAQSASSDQDS